MTKAITNNAWWSDQHDNTVSFPSYYIKDANLSYIGKHILKHKEQRLQHVLIVHRQHANVKLGFESLRI